MKGSFDEAHTADAFIQAALLASLSIAPHDLRIVQCPAPHTRPKPLPSTEQAVYAFFLRGTCLKVGKAGPNNSPRFCFQHYDVRVGSTLAKSILKSKKRVIALAPDLADQVNPLDETTVGDWILATTERVNFYLPCAAGPFALSFLEAFLQATFRPEFEGKYA